MIREKISYFQFDNMMIQLTSAVKEVGKNCKYIYGVPRGGLPIAVHLSNHLNKTLIPSLTNMKSGCIIVDDISDTGKTFFRLKRQVYSEGSIFVTIVRLGEQKGTRGLGCIVLQRGRRCQTPC